MCDPLKMKPPLSDEVLLLVARHRGDGRHRGACGWRELRAQRGKSVWRGSPSRRVLSGVVVSAASLAEDEWKRILLDQIDSLHRLRARRAVPVRWIMEIRSLLTPAFQNSTRALQYQD